MWLVSHGAQADVDGITRVTGQVMWLVSHGSQADVAGLTRVTGQADVRRGARQERKGSGPTELKAVATCKPEIAETTLK